MSVTIKTAPTPVVTELRNAPKFKALVVVKTTSFGLQPGDIAIRISDEVIYLRQGKPLDCSWDRAFDVTYTDVRPLRRGESVLIEGD